MLKVLLSGGRKAIEKVLGVCGPIAGGAMISVPDGDEGPCHTVPPGNSTKGTVVLLDGLRLMTVFIASEVLRVDRMG
jgi:hypothetical protein